MKDGKKKDFYSSWEKAELILKDIRYHRLSPLNCVEKYIFPVNAIIYLKGSRGSLVLNSQTYDIQQFSVFYSEKGGVLSIYPQNNIFEYYIILFDGLSINSLNEDFGYLPLNPLYYQELLKQMLEKWNMPTPLNRLYVKSAFYQLIYALCEEHEKENKKLIEPDIVLMSMRYMEDHIKEHISVETLAEYFHISASQLWKLFRERIAKSPQEYCSQLRIEKVKYYLKTTSMTLKEISQELGYYDEYYLSKTFKKHVGLSPLTYRTKNTLKHGDLSILQEYINSYNKNEIENQYHYEEGVYNMSKSFKSKAFIVGALSFMLLLNGCSKEAVENNTVENTPAPTATESEEIKETRVVSTVLGDVEIPANPERVATDQYMGYLLKLGIVPVGARDMLLDEFSALNSGIDLTGVEKLGSFPMDAELLIGLEPDLIISGGPEENASEYNKIATTVHIPYWEGESTNDPLEKLRKISKVFGKEDIAEAWITEFENKLVESKKSIEGIVKEGETVSVFIAADDAIYVQAPQGGNYGSSTIYNYLGLPATDKAKEITEGFANISLEVVGDYAGDYVFVYYYSKEALDTLTASEIWNTIPAVQKGKVFVYGGMENGKTDDEFVMEDPYSLEQQVDTIVSLLLGEK